VIRIHIFCEGQTEETFVRELLYSNFLRQNIALNPILVRTSSVGKGGLVRYAKIKPQLIRKCREDRTAVVTTMFDLFRLPGDFPGQVELPNTQDPFEKAERLENSLKEDVGEQNFIPNLLVYEFEGLFFSNTDAFSGWFDKSVVDALAAERNTFPSPEHINDGPETAPSKRIMRHCPGYNKPLHGSIIAMDIGLDVIRGQCRHFNTWLQRLESLGTQKQLLNESVPKKPDTGR